MNLFPGVLIMTNKILNLSEDLFYGAGRHKKCYLHPTEDIYA